MHDSPQFLHKTPLAAAAIVHAGAYAARQGCDFPPHKHIMWEIVYYRSGNIPCPIGDEVYESQPGLVLVTPPQTIHSEQAVTAYSNFNIGLHAPPHQPWPRACLDDSERLLGQACASIVREWGAQAAQREAMLTALLAQLDIQLQRAREQAQLPSVEQLVRQVAQWIEERFARRVVIHDLAREAGVSPSYLRAQFVRLRGQSPGGYLQEVRIQNALALLRTSNLTLEAIASLSGYDSASHLSRYIKRATGSSPGALRA